MESAATFEIAKLLLVLSPFHVRSAISSSGLCLYFYGTGDNYRLMYISSGHGLQSANQLIKML